MTREEIIMIATKEIVIALIANKQFHPIDAGKDTGVLFKALSLNIAESYGQKPKSES